MRSTHLAAQGLARLASTASTRCAHLWAAVRDFLSGCAGLDDYARYLAHLRRHHAEHVPLSREAFFRRALDARWDGVRRCC